MCILLLLAALIAALWALGGCTYSPSDTNFHVIAPPSPHPNISIVIPNDSTLTVLRGIVTISFKTVLNGHKLITVYAYMDSAFISFYSEGDGTFQIQSANYPDGRYTLTVQFTLSTATGSLADRLGDEEYVLEKKYAVTIFNGTITSPTITSVNLVNGAGVVSWNEYTQPDRLRRLLGRIPHRYPHEGVVFRRYGRASSQFHPDRTHDIRGVADGIADQAFDQ
jgi:hypothetical protein